MTSRFERTITCNDGLRTVTVSRDRIALNKLQYPVHSPTFLSMRNQFLAKRLSLDHKERLLMESAYSKSITDNEEKVDKFLVSSFPDLLSRLNLIDLRNGWIAHV